jgi:uncharacterized lipoprotein YmbA
MIKKIIIIGAVILTGCTTQPKQTYYPADMTNFIANCRQAHAQIDFLQREIDAYLAYHQTVPVTLEDQRYFGRLKNNIWSLRSTCNARYL